MSHVTEPYEDWLHKRLRDPARAAAYLRENEQNEHCTEDERQEMVEQAKQDIAKANAEVG